MLLIPTLLCPKSWEGMSGNETQRFCTYCKKHVHNLEALSVNERLALLSSPAASICSRYQVAIRRPAKGKEESYYLHIAKHGAGVALVGSVLLVLWEMHGQQAKEKFYRTVGPNHTPEECTMPNHFYCEHRVMIVGALEIPRCPPAPITNPVKPEPAPTHVDLKLDPLEIDKLIEQTKASPPEPPRIDLINLE
jgi:hypothetical protein